jgi:hypothetical protein
VLSNINQTDAWLSYGLAFVGGYGDAASFVLAKTYSGLKMADKKYAKVSRQTRFTSVGGVVSLCGSR